MAEKKGTTIVIKKITAGGGGHHGGAWKVAFADFMTAMMAFFLVMWLLNQTPETKKAVSDYFSTPSVIEYSFSNYGVEITLEKLFLDLMNEPLKAFQEFLEPVDKTPNLLDMGSAKVVAAAMADQLGDVAKNVSISPDGLEFDIPDTHLFDAGTSNPSKDFVASMEKVKGITAGLADANLSITSMLFHQSVPGSVPAVAEKVANERLDMLQKKIQAGLEHPSVDVKGLVQVISKKDFVEGQGRRPMGLIRLRIKQKEIKSDGSKPRKLEDLFGSKKPDMNVYDNFVKQVSERKAKAKQSE